MAVLCSVAIRYDQWFVERTNKGRRLKETFGETRAVWIWRSCLLAGVAFGACLATDLISPMSWDN